MAVSKMSHMKPGKNPTCYLFILFFCLKKRGSKIFYNIWIFIWKENISRIFTPIGTRLQKNPNLSYFSIIESQNP